jgi:hypothetical protein
VEQKDNNFFHHICCLLVLTEYSKRGKNLPHYYNLVESNNHQPTNNKQQTTMFCIGLAICGQLQLLWSESGGKEVVKEAVKHGRVSIVHIPEEFVIEFRKQSVTTSEKKPRSEAQVAAAAAKKEK